MTTPIQTALLLTAAVIAMATSAQAQWTPGNVTQDLQRLRQQFNGNTTPQNNVIPRQSSETLFYRKPGANPIHNTRPHGHYQHPGTPVHPGIPGRPYPQYPAHVTPDQFDGYNPYTGGIDTRNEQVGNTYYDRHREASKNNGTRRWVRRPIYDAHGKVSGYQEGYVWKNSVTGIEHAELQNVTANDKGGTHRQIEVRSVQ